MEVEEEEEEISWGGQSDTHISLTENDVNYAANYDEEVKNIPGITKVTLHKGGAGRMGLKRSIRQTGTEQCHRRVTVRTPRRGASSSACPCGGQGAWEGGRAGVQPGWSPILPSLAH